MKIALFFILFVAVHIKSSKFQWKKMQKQNLGLPSSVQLYRLNTTKSLFGTKLVGTYSKIDFSDKNLEFKVVSDRSQLKTPIQWAQQDQNIVYTAMNGGFFSSRVQSTTFICSAGQVTHCNTRNMIISQKIFPTVGAIGQLQSGSFGIQYIYSFGEQNETYTYQKPNPYPGPQPSLKNGKKWAVKQGVGSGPILLKYGQQIKDNFEHFDLQKISIPRSPRSGICYDKQGKLFLVVIDGRSKNSDGVSLDQFGILMQDLGCVDALNLDGGGSSLLYGNNQLLNCPCQTPYRQVMSTILIRDRNKKKRPNLKTSSGRI